MAVEIKVATYNIRKCVGLDRKCNPERILAVLKEIDADIIALQEADKRFGNRMSALPPELIAANSDWVPAAINQRQHSIGWHGNALLVRRGIDIRHAQILPIPTLEPRGAVLAELKVEGRIIRVIGAHLDLSGLWRRRQIRAILSYLDSAAQYHPTIIMGDFNQWSDRGALSEFAFHHHRLIKSPPTFHSSKAIARLDRIIVSHDIHVDDNDAHHSLLSKKASDHLPLWARIKIA